MKSIRSQRYKLSAIGLTLIMTVAALLYALYMCFYCAWLTAVPPDTDDAHWALWAIIWLHISVALLFLGCLALWRLIVAWLTLKRLRYPPGTCPICGYDLCDSSLVCPDCGVEKMSPIDS